MKCSEPQKWSEVLTTVDPQIDHAPFPKRRKRRRSKLMTQHQLYNTHSVIFRAILLHPALRLHLSHFLLVHFVFFQNLLAKACEQIVSHKSIISFNSTLALSGLTKHSSCREGFHHVKYGCVHPLCLHSLQASIGAAYPPWGSPVAEKRWKS